MSHQKFYFQYRKEVLSLWQGSEYLVSAFREQRQSVAGLMPARAPEHDMVKKIFFLQL